MEHTKICAGRFCRNSILAKRNLSESSKKSGFTLVELLIAISILAILSLVGLASFIQVTKNSRDSKRISDIRQIQASLEQYFADQFFYPSTISRSSSLTSTTGNPAPPANIKTYLNTVPSDPTGPIQYLYQPSSSSGSACDNSGTKCSRYCLYARMENSQNANPLSSCRDISGYSFEATTP